MRDSELLRAFPYAELDRTRIDENREAIAISDIQYYSVYI